MSGPSLRQLIDRNQATASDPDLSAWVSASAGTGKTTVLVNRVLRLMLHRDTATGPYARPENILCLTYTRAAAGEMENRLFSKLAEWAVASEAELAGALKDLRGVPATPDDIRRARQLFAVTLDTKGGLKIYTIHAFCERLLHRFPLEAGVPADFVVLDDQERRALREAAIDEVLDFAVRNHAEPVGRALSRVIAASAEGQFRETIEAALAKHEDLRAIRSLRGSGFGWEAEEAALRDLLGAPEGRTEGEILEAMAGVIDDSSIETVIEALRSGSKRDHAVADCLRQVLGVELIDHRAARLRAVFFRTDGIVPKVPASLATKAVCEADPEAADVLLDARERFVALAAAQAALHVASSTRALLTLADHIHEAYERRKQLRSALDYDDLIFKTIALLEGVRAAAWVLYKLDYGIDHILVDEAQDTSPAQWRVITALTQEFFAGEGARHAARTVFAVGDEKQSIYSFQGADPAAFAQQGRKFSRAAEAARSTLKPVPLTISFRSTEAVLNTVDAVFALEEAGKGVAWDGEGVVHHAIRAGESGLVELWEEEEPASREAAHAMEPHLDTGAGPHARDRLAERIAETIRHWLNTGERLEARDRPMRPGDILVLVRNRDPLVQRLIRELKARGIPVAGADRMKLSEQLAVLDLMALGDFVLLPEDDLTFAAVLKSPLIGLDDDDLFEIGWNRTGSLWEALRAASQDNDRFAAASERLAGWLDRADAEPPYEFFSRVLEEEQMRGRLAMIGRLGPDAGDALDEFLNLALDYERLAHPSLQEFLAWLRKTEIEVKRDMEQDRDEVRIMTVHGAKGLEANVVILPDTCRPPGGGRGNRPDLLPLARKSAPPGAPDHLVWLPSGTMVLPAVEEAKRRRKDAEMQEYHRLLYVAMTRARDRLYVCGWRQNQSLPEGCWYLHLKSGLEGLARPATGARGESVLRYTVGTEQGDPARDSVPPGIPAAEPLPAWASADAAIEEPASFPATPSAMPTAADEHQSYPEQDVIPPLDRCDQSRFLRGRIIHALLQHLPGLDRDRQGRLAQDFVALRGAALDPAVRADVVEETLKILADETFAPLFAPGSLAEVPVAAWLDRDPEIGPPLAISGQIDRLAILDDAILIVDYKTNRPSPQREADVADAYKAQLAAYRATIRRMFPGLTVRAALLWTDTPRLMELSPGLLDEFEARFRGRAAGS